MVYAADMGNSARLMTSENTCSWLFVHPRMTWQEGIPIGILDRKSIALHCVVGVVFPR